MELLTFMAANPWLSFFVLLILAGLTAQVVSAIKEAYINTIWCVRGIPPVVKFDSAAIDALDAAAENATKQKKKKEDDENQLKDCR
jgi:hypothetical protein